MTIETIPYLDGSKSSEELLGVERGTALKKTIDGFIDKQDKAMKADPLGGIDLNSKALDLQTSNVGKFSFPVPTPEMIQDMSQTTGFTPTIIQVAPIMNLPLILGFVDEGEDDSNESTFNISSLDSMILKERFNVRNSEEV